MKAAINGVVCDVENAAELPRTRRGVFETMLWIDAAPRFWAEHWDRFVAGIRWASLPDVGRADDALALAREIGAANGVTTGVLRLAQWRSNEGQTEWRIEVTPPRAHQRQPEFTLTTGAILPPADAARPFKHLDRGRWLDALRTARARGFDECVLVDESRNAIEGGVSNIFFVSGGTLHTPALHHGPLPGIMRAHIIAAAQRYGISVREGSYRLTEVFAADEIWLTNSLIGIRPVARFDDRAMPAQRATLTAFRERWRQEFDWDPVIVMS